MSALAGKQVVVTGGAGFLGREVCRELENFRPGKIVVPRSREYDLRRASDIRRLLNQTRPQVIVHLAAVVGGIGVNRANPGKYFYDNAAMALHLLEEARLANVEKIVAIGTICSYPKHTPAPFKEEDLWNGYPEETNAPYGLAKKMMLVQGQAYRQQYGMDIINLLPVNLYGPGDNFDLASCHVIPAVIRKALEAVERHQEWIDLWGTGAAPREFLFVRDAARAIALASDRYSDSDPVNIGSGQEISIRDLAQLICELCDFHGELRWDATKPEGQPRRVLDVSRARDRFGFVADTPLVQGLRETIAWYRQHRQGESPAGPTLFSVPGQASAQSSVETHWETPLLFPDRTTDSESETSNANVRVTIQPRQDMGGSSPGPIRRAFITGITGQDGSYLAELLLSKGYEVHGLIRRSSTFNTRRLDSIYTDPHDAGTRLHLHYGDLMDGSSLTGLIVDVEPDEIYNLAAQSHVRVSFDQPVYTVDAAALGTLRVLEAARCLQRRKAVRFYQASSSEMFGEAGEVPQSETTPFRPRSPYACAKVFAYYQTINYRQAYDLFACNGILFNHESPRRGETFVTRKITRAAARIRESLQTTLFLGNLDARRDWGFAADYVQAMWLMLQQPQPDDYVIATGESHSVRDFLELAFGHLGLRWQSHLEIDARYFRPTEVHQLVGDATKAREVLGWRPKTTFAELVQLMVESDWQRVRSKEKSEPAPQPPMAAVHESP